MKYVSMIDCDDGSSLEEKINEWIVENEDTLLEILDIEYKQHGNIYLATITYEERDWKII